MSPIIPEKSLRSHAPDSVFGITASAKQALIKYGKENTYNATIGTLMDENEEIIAFDSVYDCYASLPRTSIAGYAAIEGENEFLNSVTTAAFAQSVPEGYIRSVATPGGAGAIRHAIANFTYPGETFLTSDWHWPVYSGMAAEFSRGIETFELFDENNKFNLASYKEKFEQLISKQQRVLSIINSPANNPTGFALTDNDWDEVIELASYWAEKDKCILFLIDIAYIAYAGAHGRDFMKKFGNLHRNIFTMFAFSASKSLSMYGMRNGAIIGVSSDKEICDDFFYSCKFSNRTNWSNGNKGAMLTLAKIYTDKTLYERYERELNQACQMLSKRAQAFFTKADELKLAHTHYTSGFFACILHPFPQRFSESLCEKNLFTVPFQKGVRVALCSMSLEKCAKVPILIAQALKEEGF